jgi:signal transduction histidine kinase
MKANPEGSRATNNPDDRLLLCSVGQLSARLLQARDEERSRLGRELHDSTAQTLGALAINLALLKEYLRSTTSPEVSRILTELTELTHQASREIRNTAYLLHPPMLEKADLPSALGRFVEGFVERTKIQVSLEFEPGLNRLPKDIELAVFRVVQESLSNLYRHSGSPTARVRLALESSGILLEVSDEGKGLPANHRDRQQDAPLTPGMGISGMRERIQQIGGSFKVISAKPGVTIKAVVPLGPVGADSEARITSHADDLLSLTSELVGSA